jgi:hypothetical protein
MISDNINGKKHVFIAFNINKKNPTV